jgi:alginate O-acetyltransferase complex protein AlgI
MDQIVLFFIALGLVSVLTSWLLPYRFAFSAISIVTFLGICVWSLPSALSLLSLTLALPLFLRFGEGRFGKNAVLTIGVGLIVGVFILSRYSDGLAWIGIAYYSLRLIHVLVEWWLGRAEAPTVANHLRYQFFAPVLIAGPINRMPHFLREWDRRSWNLSEFWSGLERLIFGIFLVVVLSSALLGKVETAADRLMSAKSYFLQQWLGSAIDWIQLYISFSGYTSIALGLALMMGLRLEENFNRPYLATNLIDFWSRWHMTLTSWCRDYVYQPISAVTRNPALGVFAGMLVLGLWHEFSVYYVLWAAWQSIGIILTHILKDRALPNLHPLLRRVGGAIIVLSWLSLAQPVIRSILLLI